VAVAAPSVPEELSLELHEHAPEPPASSRNLRVAAPPPEEPLFEPALPPKLQTPVPEAPELALAALAFDDEPLTQQFTYPRGAAQFSEEVALDDSVHEVEAAPEPHLVPEARLSVPPGEALVEVDRGEHVVEPAAEPHLVTAESVEHLEALVEPAQPPALVEAAPVELPPADVIRPQLVAAEVAAYLTAARAPRPETFGLLLDAALEL